MPSNDTFFDPLAQSYHAFGQVKNMISYQPFYETLAEKSMTEYCPIFKKGITANTLHRMKHGEHISTKTINGLCEALGCEVTDIVEYIPDEG